MFHFPRMGAANWGAKSEAVYADLRGTASPMLVHSNNFSN
jgi:hypothetical protein